MYRWAEHCHYKVSGQRASEADGRPYVDDSILQHTPTNALTELHDVFASRALVVLEIPARTLLVVGDLGRVVAFVEVLEHGGEDFGLFVRQLDSFARGFEELCSAGLGEVWRFGEDVFVVGEEASGGADCDGDDGGVEVAWRDEFLRR